MTNNKQLNNSSGVTLLELLVSMGITSAVITASLGLFLNSSKLQADNEIITETNLSARTLLDNMAYDFRMIGSGMPIGQRNFLPGTAGLADAPLAVMLDADNESIQFRISEDGKNTVLTSDLTPAGGTETFNVLSTENFMVGDLIYISDMIAGGDDGLQGRIISLTDTSFTIDSSYVTGAGASFPAGSSVSMVSEVRYFLQNSGTEVWKQGRFGWTMLASNANFSLRYLDESGNEVILPLTNASVSSELAAIEITATVDPTQVLRGRKNIYSREASQIVTIRNLVYNR